MYVAKGETFTTLWTPSLSGTTPRPTGALPRYVVFNDTTPIYSGSVTHPYSISGVYRISVSTTGSLFVTGAYYNISSEARLSGHYKTDVVGQFYLGAARNRNLSGINSNVYYADLHFNRTNSGVDKYSVIWFKNTQLVPITSGSLYVYNQTGLPIINAQLLTINPLTGLYYHNTTGVILNSGERYVAQTYGIIDGVQRSWRVPISRDYNV